MVGVVDLLMLQKDLDYFVARVVVVVVVVAQVCRCHCHWMTWFSRHGLSTHGLRRQSLDDGCCCFCCPLTSFNLLKEGLLLWSLRVGLVLLVGRLIRVVK